MGSLMMWEFGITKTDSSNLGIMTMVLPIYTLMLLPMGYRINFQKALDRAEAYNVAANE